MKFFDEMRGFDDDVRAPYRVIHDWLGSQGVDELKRKIADAESIFRRAGITFAVYGEAKTNERLIPFDSTLRSNLSVGLPLDFLMYERDSLAVTRLTRIEENNEYFKALSGAWSSALRESFANIREFDL